MSSMLVTGAGIRDEAGRFRRIRSMWTPESWSDGYVDNHGYFRVYRPDCPAAWEDGYAKRYVVVFWLATGRIPDPGEDLHHRDEDRTNDCFENLTLIGHGEHGRLHNPKTEIVCVCCAEAFPLPRGKLARSVRFCSQSCYHAWPRSVEHKKGISLGLKLAYSEGRR